MPETLLSPSSVLLYGREVVGLAIGGLPAPVSEAAPGGSLGANTFLENQLTAAGARIARIYGFSYEGHYYNLAKPALFLVHGAGEEAESATQAVPGPRQRGPWRAARAPDGADFTGVAATGTSFSEDIRVWVYDKGDFSLRMDVRTGPLEQILLEGELSSDVLKTFFGGASARLRTPQGGGSD
jgi:hypothetical protein